MGCYTRANPRGSGDGIQKKLTKPFDQAGIRQSVFPGERLSLTGRLTPLSEWIRITGRMTHLVDARTRVAFEMLAATTDMLRADLEVRGGL